MSAGEYLLGAGLFAVNWGAAAGAAGVFTYRRLGHMNHSAALVAAVVLWALGVLLTNLVPLALGVLSPISVSLCSVAWAAGAVVLARRGRRPADRPGPWPLPGTPTRASVVLAWIGVGIAAVWALGMAIGLARQPPTNTDTLSFHLPGIARWIESGSLWQIDQLIPLVPTGHYPGTGNVIQLSAVLPWHSDFAYRQVGIPFLALLGLSVYATARELGCEKPVSALIGATVATIPSVLEPTLIAPIPDVILMSCFAAGVLFLVRHFRTRLVSDLVLAGIALGIAFGTKWYGVTSVPVLIAVWVGCLFLARSRPKLVAQQGELLGGIALALGCIWLIRNWVESGNPFFPAHLELGPVAFDAPVDPRGEQIEATVLDFLGDGEAWRESFLSGWLSSLGLAGYALAVAVPAAAVTVARVWRRPAMTERRWLGLALVASAVVLGLTYASTPSTAPAAGAGGLPEVTFNARYAVPALVMAAACAAWVAARATGFWLHAIEALAVVCILHGVGEALDPEGPSLLAAIVGLGAAILIWRRLWRTAPGRYRNRWVRRGHARRWRIAVAVVASAAVIGAGVAGYAAMKGFEERGYGGYATTDYVIANAPEDRRIGIVAAWGNETTSPIRAMFGPRLRNVVEYVGVERSEQLAPVEGEEQFREAIEKQRPDLLLIGRGYATNKERPKQLVWASEIGFSEVARDATLVLMRAPWSRVQ